MFAEVYFALVPGFGEQETREVLDSNDCVSGPISLADPTQVIQAIEERGGHHMPLDSDLKDLTHIISQSSEFPGYFDAVDAFLNVVRPSWVEQSIHKGKLANARSHSPDPSLFMADVVLTFADDIPQGDKDAIIGGLVAMGGIYSQPLTRAVTHIVALSMNNDLCAVVVERDLTMKIVLPHWFGDCLKLGRRIDAGPYTLPNPRLLNAGGDVQILSSQDIEGALSLDTTSLQNPSRVCTVFRGHVFRLDPDLNISTHLSHTLEQIISDGGGSVTSSLTDADTLICQFRSGPNYKNASREGKEVGNLVWLYYLINHDRWVSPLRRLLHYPVPKAGLPGFKDLEISLSNYTGTARMYLESLITAAGAKFTKTMSDSNTHLITAHSRSQKCQAAREWNIDVVNHLWLEESYAKGHILTVTNQRYTYLPEKTNLTQVLGQTPIDREQMRKYHYYEPTGSEADDHLSDRLTRKGSIDGDDVERTSFGQTVRSSASRNAKQRAIKSLHKLAPDIALYEKESKRKGGVTHPVRDPERKADRAKLSANRKRSRDGTADEEDGDPSGGAADDVTIKKAKTKPPSTSSTPLRVFITGGKEACDRDKEVRLANLPMVKVLEEQGLTGGIDILVAARFMRTTKFLVAISWGAAIVSPAWVDHVLKSRGTDLSTQDYELQDANFEQEQNVCLSVSLERARAFAPLGGLLSNWTIFIDPDVSGKVKPWKQIIEANGGRIQEYRGRLTEAPKAKRRRKAGCERDVEAMETYDGDGLFQEGHTEGRRLFLISPPDHPNYWEKFKCMAEAGGYTPCIVKTEWLLRVALTQDLTEWNEDWELDAAAAGKGGNYPS